MFTGIVSLVSFILNFMTNHLDFSQGQILKHDHFNAESGDEQIITFGNCEDNVVPHEPSSLPSIESNNPFFQP